MTALLIAAAIAGALYLWHRQADAAAHSVAYKGASRSIDTTTSAAVSAFVGDTVSAIGQYASQVSVQATPGMLSPITGGLLFAAPVADWGIIAPGVAVFTYPGGSTTVTASLAIL